MSDPYVIEAIEARDTDLARRVLGALPFLGDEDPDGWDLDEVFFVDLTGLGEDGEPALSHAQFAAALRVGHGYGVVRNGPYQAVIGAYCRRPLDGCALSG